MRRARLHLAAKDLSKARLDLEATLKDAPPESNQLIDIARLLGDEGQFKEAIVYYDRWIAAHPADKQMSNILNQRCWTRALWGQELDAALADCNLSLDKGRKDPAILDSRGMVHLRRGELDAAIDDYDQALRMTPKMPWSLYGRGLARRKKGLVAAGDADIALATALAPQLPAFAKRYGLEPETPAQPTAVTR